MFVKICIVSSGLAGSTITFWKRLSKAASFSTCFLYSSRVVAPMIWISPLAKAGLNILEASIEPLDPPAPIIVWISSMKRIIDLSSSTSAIRALILSSNCPLYLVPATIEAKSNITTLLSNKILLTLRCEILSANPSAIEDLPTPASPSNIGLFFFLLERIWETLSISLSLPTIGSNLPSSAYLVKSRL